MSGLFQYKTAVNILSDTYDPNDLGYLLNNNSITHTGSFSYNLLKPTKNFLSQIYSVNFTNTYLYKPFNCLA
ncbi:MAG: DUF5916 domain-containing protein [Ferruginibacter sp.]